MNNFGKSMADFKVPAIKLKNGKYKLATAINTGVPEMEFMSKVFEEIRKGSSKYVMVTYDELEKGWK